MLKEKAFKRIWITSVAVLIVLCFYSLFKIEDNTIIYDESFFIEEEDTKDIYCLNKDSFISKTSIYVENDLSLEEKVKTLLETMIQKNNKNALLPSYYEPIIPKNTKVLNIEVNNDIIKINFSKELLNINKDKSEKMIEAIIYTCSEFKEILGIQIYVENELLRYIPNTNKTIPSVLTNDFGINKVFDINSNKDINKVILYYLGSNNEVNTYVPVTKYLNDERLKIEIIVEELKNRFLYTKSLRSYLNEQAVLEDYKINDSLMILKFSNGIFDDLTEQSFKEEGLLALCYSVFANYEKVDTVEIYVENEKIYEKSTKTS